MRIGFIGDTILSDEAAVGPALLNILQGTDFNIANLEGPFIHSASMPRRKAGMHQLTDQVTLLKLLNVRAVSLANNHMMDFGAEAISHTLLHLKQNGIGVFGAGSEIDDAFHPFEIKERGVVYRFFGGMQRYYSGHHFAHPKHPGIAQYLPKVLLQKASKSPLVRNVLFLHWNQEFEDYPEPVSKKTAEGLSTHFDLIIGSHPHCIQGIQSINGTPIVYSLGNFILPHRTYFQTTLKSYPNKSYQSFLFIWNTDNSEASYEVIPLVVREDGLFVDVAPTGIDQQIIENISSYSEALKLSEKAYRRFYMGHRNRKNRPLLTDYEVVNRIKIGIYMSSRECLLQLEEGIAQILDAMGMRQLIKKSLSRILKRYQ